MTIAMLAPACSSCLSIVLTIQAPLEGNLVPSDELVSRIIDALFARFDPPIVCPPRLPCFLPFMPSRVTAIVAVAGQPI